MDKQSLDAVVSAQCTCKRVLEMYNALNAAISLQLPCIMSVTGLLHARHHLQPVCG